MDFLNNHPNILIIPLRFIGDTIVTTPLIRNIREQWPDSHITVMVSALTESLLAPCPYVNEVWREPRKGFNHWVQQLKEKQFDMVFILRKSVSAALACQLAGIPVRVGYDKQRWFQPLHYKRWGCFLTHQAKYPSLKTTTPQAESHLSLLTSLNKPKQSYLPELWTEETDRVAIDQLIETSGLHPQQPLAGFHGVAASHGKIFKPELYYPVLQRLHQQGFSIITSGLEADYTFYEEIKIQSQVPLINWAGKTTLRQTVAWYQRLSVLLSVDSSPLHIAVAVRIPKVIALYGPTNHQQWGYGHCEELDFRPVFNDLPCRPCYAKECSHNRCRTDLSTQQLVNALETNRSH